MTHQLTIKKIDLTQTIKFAIEYVPGADRETLETFLALVNTTGTFGSVTCEQIITKMRLTLKHVPTASVQSLLMLAELLELPPTLPASAKPRFSRATVIRIKRPKPIPVPATKMAKNGHHPV